MLFEGSGVPRDGAQALAWCLKAAERGDLEAQNFLGIMYTYGMDIPDDYEQATAWFLKAAEQGDPNAQYNLGMMYANGMGTPQNDEQAMAWVRKAADQGHVGAQIARGHMLYTLHMGSSAAESEVVLFSKQRSYAISIAP